MAKGNFLPSFGKEKSEEWGEVNYIEGIILCIQILNLDLHHRPKTNHSVKRSQVYRKKKKDSYAKHG